MNRTTLMEHFKARYGGEYVRENGKWYWAKDEQKKMVSNSWLNYMLNQPSIKEEPPYAVSEHKDETLVKDVGQQAPLEEQKPQNETSELSQEELKKEKERQKRRERRAKKKLEKQNETE